MARKQARKTEEAAAAAALKKAMKIKKSPAPENKGPPVSIENKQIESVEGAKE